MIITKYYTMNYRNFTSFMLLFMLIFGWQASYAQDVPKLHIDPAQAYGGSVSDYFDSVEYIPLETTRESILGEIKNIVITDSSIVAYDYDTNCILFFTKSGKFITKIKEGNVHEPPYISISYDRANKIILANLYDPSTAKAKTKYYSLVGIPQEAVSITIELEQTEMLPLGNGYFVVRKGCYLPQGEKAKDSIYNLIEIYKGNKLYKSFLPLNPKVTPAPCTWGLGFVRPISVIEDGSFYVSTPLDYYVYKINKDTAIKMYQFVFPANRSFSQKTMNNNNEHFIDSMRVAVFNDFSRIIIVSNIFYHKNFLFFKINPLRILQHQGSENDNQYNFIYDTLSQKLVSIERISPDETTSYLPMLDKYGSRVKSEGLLFENGYFYSDISSLQMFAAKEATKDKTPQYPPVLQEYFKTQNRKSNPVIVRMKLKE